MRIIEFFYFQVYIRLGFFIVKLKTYYKERKPNQTYKEWHEELMNREKNSWKKFFEELEPKK